MFSHSFHVQATLQATLQATHRVGGESAIYRVIDAKSGLI